MENLADALDNLDFIALLDIALVTLVIYGTLFLIRGTRAVQVLRGLLVLALILFLFSSVVELPAFGRLVNIIFPVLLVAIPVIFQPELRRALEQLGRAGGFFRLLRRSSENQAVAALKEASLRLSQRRCGALVVFEKDTGLQEYVDTGILLDARPSAELLLTVFDKHTELHDGAVIVRDEKVIAAACVLPLSTSRLSDRQMGLRHRAALGISQVSDAVTVIISEETGKVSVTHGGRILPVEDIAHLDTLMYALLQNRSLEAAEEEK